MQSLMKIRSKSVNHQAKFIVLAVGSANKALLPPGHWTKNAFGSLGPSLCTPRSLAAGERGCSKRPAGPGRDHQTHQPKQ